MRKAVSKLDFNARAASMRQRGRAAALALSLAAGFAAPALLAAPAALNSSVAQAPPEQRVPNLPRGTPFDDLFEEFFKRRQQQGQQGQRPRPRPRATSLGSGFVIDSAGVIVTNNHVIDGAAEVTVI